jgi:NodT family efflux transporter outer membrane factor (OMF) lipoprotein
VLGGSGCAQIPLLSKPEAFKTSDQLASREVFDAPLAAWPENDWWHSYGDAQLDQLIEEALRDSPNLGIARARLAQAEAMSQIAGGALKPEVGAFGSVTEQKQSYNYLTPRAALPQGWNDYGVAGLNFNWELDFWGKNRSALAAAVSEQRAREVEVAQVRMMLSSSVAAAYAELAHLYAMRDTAERALAVRSKTTDLMRRRQRQELETLGTVRQAEARQSAAEAQLQIANEFVALQKNAIAALLSAGPDRALKIERPSTRISGTFGLPAQLGLDLLGRRPDIVAARLRTEAAARQIDQHKAEFYPSINLMGFIGFNAFGLDNLVKAQSSFGAIGPAITLPIFNTERLQGQLRGAHAEYNASVAVYNATLVNALHQVADVVTSRKALDGELASLQASVDAAQQAHRIASNRYQGQLTTYLDVLAAEDALLSAERALSDAQSRTLVLDVALVQALGGGYRAPEEKRSELTQH